MISVKTASCWFDIITTNRQSTVGFTPLARLFFISRYHHTSRWSRMVFWVCFPVRQTWDNTVGCHCSCTLFAAWHCRCNFCRLIPCTSSNLKLNISAVIRKRELPIHMQGRQINSSVFAPARKLSHLESGGIRTKSRSVRARSGAYRRGRSLTSLPEEFGGWGTRLNVR